MRGDDEDSAVVVPVEFWKLSQDDEVDAAHVMSDVPSFCNARGCADTTPFVETR